MLSRRHALAHLLAASAVPLTGCSEPASAFPPAMPQPVLFADPIYLEHKTGKHPECPERLKTAYAWLTKKPLWDKFTHAKSGEATEAQLKRVHSAEHIAAVKAAAEMGGGQIEADTVMSPRSYEVACRAAGAAIAAVDSVLSKTANEAVCLIRPPGHHATRDVVMGFCLFNNVAVAAAHAIEHHGLNRVLIVDWDVHHGNGTQDIFYDSDRAWFFSAHRHPFYPGTGLAEETGTGKGLGATFNLPLKFGTPRKEYHARFAKMLEDAATRCKPDLVLISAGFDAHHKDPIGSLGLETEDFAELTTLVKQVAQTHCHGRLVSLLEGGYDLQALSESLEVHLDVLT
jgi:acetoin utilization deacetylase AcuC-like enzyme